MQLLQLKHINWANCNFKAKHAYSRPTAMTSSEMRTVWSNYNYSKYNVKSLNQFLLFFLKCILSEPTSRFLTQSCIVWANCIYFYRNEHGPSQLQLFKLESAYSEPITNISTKTCTNWASCKYLKLIRHIYSMPNATIPTTMRRVWTSYYYFNWNSFSLSQSQGFRLNRA